MLLHIGQPLVWGGGQCWGCWDLLALKASLWVESSSRCLQEMAERKEHLPQGKGLVGVWSQVEKWPVLSCDIY